MKIRIVHIMVLLVTSALSLMAQEKTGAERYGVTAFSVNFMREKPDFPEELGNQVLMGTPVKILSQESYWKQVESPEPYKAWCVEMGVVEMGKEELEEYIAAPKYIVVSEYSHVFSAPDVHSDRISDLVMGDLLRISFRDNKHRPLCIRGFAKVIMPSGRTGYVKRPDVAEFREWACKAEATQENIVRTAKIFLGVPYQWGGTSIKGVDCSGFTRMVWFMNGILLPRNASQQASTGMMIPYPDCGKDKVSTETMREFISGLEPGDLLFFGSGSKPGHVGIYIGEGDFIHASQMVRISSLIPEDPDFYTYSYRLMWACRVIGQEDSGKGVESILYCPAYFPQN